jgi:hypothetical protein
MALMVKLEMPAEVEESLRAQGVKIEDQVNEAFALELYRQ